MLYSGQKHGFTALSSQKWTAITARLNEMCVTWAHEHQSERNASHVLNAFFTELFAWFEQTQPKDLKSRQGAMTLLQRILLVMPGSVIERAAKLMELTTKNTRKPEMNEREGKIILCTLTGSKGLEWPKVFIMNVNHEVIPAIKDEPDLEKKIAEERRLFYVGMTRAEDELVIHYHKDKPSMFIVELGTLLPRDMVGSTI
jgi:superfamily I DNA/RNA helicase